MVAAIAGAALLSLCACKDGGDSPPEPAAEKSNPPKAAVAGDTKPTKASAEPAVPTPPPPPEISPLEKLVAGASPEEVKLIKGHGSTWSHKYPAGWASSPGRDLLFMVMKRSADAAMMCESGNSPFLEELHVTPAITKNLAKRAPIMGKDLELVGEDEIVEIGAQKIRARAGHMRGTLFGAPEGDLFWWDFRMKQKEGLPYHVSCLAALKAGADEKTVRELQAVVRSIRIPPDNVLEPATPPAKKK